MKSGHVLQDDLYSKVLPILLPVGLGFLVIFSLFTRGPYQWVFFGMTVCAALGAHFFLQLRAQIGQSWFELIEFGVDVRLRDDGVRKWDLATCCYSFANAYFPLMKELVRAEKQLNRYVLPDEESGELPTLDFTVESGALFAGWKIMSVSSHAACAAPCLVIKVFDPTCHEHTFRIDLERGDDGARWADWKWDGCSFLCEKHEGWVPDFFRALLLALYPKTLQFAEENLQMIRDAVDGQAYFHFLKNKVVKGKPFYELINVHAEDSNEGGLLAPAIQTGTEYERGGVCVKMFVRAAIFPYCDGFVVFVCRPLLTNGALVVSAQHDFFGAPLFFVPSTLKLRWGSAMSDVPIYVSIFLEVRTRQIEIIRRTLKVYEGISAWDVQPGQLLGKNKLLFAARLSSLREAFLKQPSEVGFLANIFE